MIIAVVGCTVDKDGNSCNLGAGKDTVADELVRSHGFVKMGFADPFKRFVQDVYDFSDDQIWGSSKYRNGADRRYFRGFGDFGLVCSACREACISGELEKAKPATGIEVPCDACGDVYDKNALYTMRIPQFLTPRYALQQIGSEWGRNCYDPTWVEYLLKTVRRLEQGGAYYDSKLGLRYTAEVEGVMEAKKNVVVSDLRFRNEIGRLRQEGAKIILLVHPVDSLPSGVDLSHGSENELKGLPASNYDLVLVNNGTIEDLQKSIKVGYDLLLSGIFHKKYPVPYLVADARNVTGISALFETTFHTVRVSSDLAFQRELIIREE